MEKTVQQFLDSLPSDEREFVESLIEENNLFKQIHKERQTLISKIINNESENYTKYGSTQAPEKR